MACPPMTTLDGRTATGILSIEVVTGAAAAGVKGLFTTEAMMSPTGVVVGAWVTTAGVLAGALLVPALGLDEASAAGDEPPPALEAGVVAVFFEFEVEGSWKTGGAEVDDPTTGTGVFFVTSTVLVKADPVAAAGAGDSEPPISGPNEGDPAAGDAGAAADNVTTVSAGWNDKAVVVFEAVPGKHTPNGQAELTPLDVDRGAFALETSGTTNAVQATSGVTISAGGSDALLAVTVTLQASVTVEYTVGGTEPRYVLVPEQLSRLVVLFW